MASSSSAAAAAALPSQDYFDETLLENEECFELSPDEAVRETIDQFRRQLGVDGAANDAAAVGDEGGVPSPTSVAGSGSNNAGAAEHNVGSAPAALSHLALSHPASEEGRRDRASREAFKKSLALLDGRVNTDGTVTADDTASENEEGVPQALSEVGRRCRLGDADANGRSAAPLPFLAIVQQTSSIYTLMSFLGVVDPASMGEGTNLFERLETLSATARALSNILSDHPSKDDVPCARIRSELRDAFVPALGRLVCLLMGLANAITSAGDTNPDAIPSLSSVLCDLLRLGTHAARGCEGGKVAFVQSPLSEGLTGGKGAKRGGVTALVACLSLQSDDNIKIWTEACQLLASLCRYDDHRDPSASDGALGAAGVNASSAHDHAVALQRVGAVPLLMAIAKDALSTLEAEADEGDANERLAAAVLTALRVLAINDEIIQTMVALGVLPIVTEAIRLCVPLEEEETVAAEGDDVGGQLPRRQRLAAASLGLLRNLCGNDEMKSNLCLGSADRQSASSTPSVLPHLLRAMQIYAATAQIQEHACGTLAAMALRRPGNARAILDADGPRWVLTAMKQHPDSVNVQRQGALAVRNVVSRLLRELPEGVEGEAGEGEKSALRDAFLELGAEDVLRNNAGRHQGSVDEAYAALRDLGCAVSLVKFSAEDVRGPTSGASVGRTMMFGEKHNSNFRPVYEESAGLSEGVDSAASQFGA